MRIDVHTHAFHEKIATKACNQLLNHYKTPINGNGTKEDLIRFMDLAKIDIAFVLCAATTPEQVLPANTWAIELSKNPRFRSFGTIHPDYPDWEKELDKLEQKGIKGIKFHPDFQQFFIDDKKLFPIYEAISGRFITMFHVGDVLPPDENPSSPQKIAKIIKNFPNLTLIAAHCGGYRHWEWVIESLKGLKFYMDTSSTLRFIPDNLLKDIFSAFPEDYFFFGSDYPLGDPVTEFDLLKKRLNYTESQIDALLKRANFLLDY